MQTLTLHIPDPVLMRLQLSARAHNHTVEEESIALLQTATDKIDRPRRTPEETAALMTKIRNLHDEFTAKGIWMTPGEIQAAIEHGRE